MATERILERPIRTTYLMVDSKKSRMKVNARIYAKDVGVDVRATGRTPNSAIQKALHKIPR